MNPIYRHSFVNAFLANGAISNITGNINGNNTNYYYTRTFIPVSNVYPRKLYQNHTPQAGGTFYDSNKKVIGGWGIDPPLILNLIYRATPHISGLMCINYNTQTGRHG